MEQLDQLMPWQGGRHHVVRERSLLVAKAIRQRIVDGEFSPGSQLPTWDAFGKEYAVGRNTLVRAIGQLKQQRYICSSSTRGTYVVQRPPHLHNYALVFHDRPGMDAWNQFWWALANRAAEIQTQRDCQFTIKYGVRDENNNEAHRQLLEEVANDQYAGLIFVGNPDQIAPQCLQMPRVPTVLIMSKSDQTSMPKVDIDRKSFAAKSLDWIQSRGRKKVAVLSNYKDSVHQVLIHEVQDRGMEFRPHWFLTANAELPSTAEPITRLLLCGSQPELPDALIVSNDNMVDAVLAGVIAMNKRVPEDLDILTHCNWPTPKGHVIPTCRLGYDVRQILDRCVDVINDMRAGRNVNDEVLVPALFEHEI